MNLINRIAKFSRDYSFGSGIIEFGIIAIIFGIIAFKWNNARLDYPMIEAEVTGVALEQEAYDDGNTHIRLILSIRWMDGSMERNLTISLKQKSGKSSG